MTTKTYTTFILAATCVLALGACAHSSTPSTTGAPSAPSSGEPTASQDPATAFFLSPNQNAGSMSGILTFILFNFI